ncbi:MAG: M1 family aminopeptidase [Sedimenticola sp.]
MHRNVFPIFVILVLFLPLSSQAETKIIHHELQVTIDPAGGMLTARDRLTLPTKTAEFEFLLNANLEVTAGDGEVRLEPLSEIRSSVLVRRYRAVFPQPSSRLELNYRGRIHSELKSVRQGYAGGRQATAGQISEKGVFLGLSSFWYPATDYYPVSFTLSTRLPDGWSSVSQGLQNEQGVWQEHSPQDEIYLLAGRYHRYALEGPVAEAQVYLSEADAALAQRYLKATREYLDLYQRLLGPYPYKKFALVENFWESGYGMPSFTLLGPRVIRLPFIIATSYPHEILHNWWGNGVFVDYDSGNWSEGLTAYLADHLMKEQAGNGADYRRDSLRRYADYVSTAEDFPLKAFRGNHGQISQAVGYGKTLMLFHMLRQRLGDAIFVEGLQRFYQDHLFKVAGFDEIRSSFEAVSGKDLEVMFSQWTERTGAPALSVDDLKVTEQDDGFLVTGSLRQLQQGEPFYLRVPVFTQVEDHPRYVKRLIVISERDTNFRLFYRKRPLRMRFDPLFDLFRQLHPSELPSSLGQLFGAGRVAFVLPADASRSMRKVYEEMAETWAEGGENIEILWDTDIDKLPGDRAVWLLGSENSFASHFQEQLKDDVIALEEQQFGLGNYSAALSRRHPNNQAQTLGLISLHDRDALDALMRKLPHYGKYSYVVFEGEELVNQLKGHWKLSDSALDFKLVDTSTIPGLALPPHAPITAVLEATDEEFEAEDDSEDCE